MSYHRYNLNTEINKEYNAKMEHRTVNLSAKSFPSIRDDNGFGLSRPELKPDSKKTRKIRSVRD